MGKPNGLLPTLQMPRPILGFRSTSLSRQPHSRITYLPTPKRIINWTTMVQLIIRVASLPPLLVPGIFVGRTMAMACKARLVRVRSCVWRMISSEPSRCLDQRLPAAVCWVPPAGLEPASQWRWILSPLRLPIPPRGQLFHASMQADRARLRHAFRVLPRHASAAVARCSARGEQTAAVIEHDAVE